MTVDVTAPTANAGSAFTKNCTQNINGSGIGASSVSGVTYAWTPSTGLSSNTAADPTADPSSTTTYTLVATQTSSGCTATDDVTVTVDQTAPTASAGSAFTKTCTTNANGSAIGTSFTNGNTYSWTPSTGLSSSTVASHTAIHQVLPHIQ